MYKTHSGYNSLKNMCDIKVENWCAECKVGQFLIGMIKYLHRLCNDIYFPTSFPDNHIISKRYYWRDTMFYKKTQ